VSLSRVVAALLTLLSLAVLLGTAPPIYGMMRHKATLVDFEVYRTAATRARAVEPLYREEDGHYQFKYLPAFALVMVPFATMDDATAKWIWYALSVALLVAFVNTSVRSLPKPRLTHRTLFWLTVLVMAKSYVKELHFGQTNILLGMLLVGVLLAVRGGRPGLAGALTGVAIFVKPYAVIVAPWVAWVAGGPALWAFVLVLVTGLFLPAVVYGWTGNLHLLGAWFRTVTVSTAPNLMLPENISLATMWEKWLGPGMLPPVLAVVSGIGLLTLIAAVVVQRRKVAQPEYLELGLLAVLVPLLSPQGWDYVLLLATPAVACLIDRLRDMAVLQRAITLIALALVGLTIYDLLGRTIYARLMATSVVTVAAIAVAASLVQLRRRSLA
jgi:hypothetical protein